MNTKKPKLIVLFLIGCFLLPGYSVFAEMLQDSERWQTIKSGLYEDVEFLDGENIFSLTSVKRAAAGSHVPLHIQIPDRQTSKDIEHITIIIDNNPAPLSAKLKNTNFSTGFEFSTVVRIEEYTPIRAIAKMKDGKHYMNAVFVKAAGGCSGTLLETQNIAYGESELFLKNSKSTESAIARFEVSHPNFSGLQFDEISRHYIPANFIETYQVEIDGKNYFDLESSIALSTNPHFEISIPDQNFDNIRLIMVDMKEKTFEGAWQKNEIAFLD